jgi:hypothetical protein
MIPIRRMSLGTPSNANHRHRRLLAIVSLFTLHSSLFTTPRDSNHQRRRLLAIVSLFALHSSLFLCGCGGSSDAVSVTGRVTLDGGEWPATGMLYFAPIEPAEGFPRRPGTAEFDRDGRFRAQTPPDLDGLIPGRYRVTANCWLEPPSDNPSDPTGGVNAVPAKYQSPQTSDWEITVPPDGPAVEISLEASN